MSTVQIGSILKNHEFRIRKIEKIQEEFENNRTQYVDNSRFNDLSDNVMTMKKMIESLDEYDKTFKEFRTSIKNIENNMVNNNSKVVNLESNYNELFKLFSSQQKEFLELKQMMSKLETTTEETTTDNITLEVEDEK